jgi:agmatine deiminase
VGPSGTDGHVDGVAQFVSPGHVVLEAPSNPESTEYAYGQRNLAALEAARDAAGRAFTISRLDIEPHPDGSVAYANFYLANGAVIIPTDGTSGDAAAMDFLAGLYPDRQVVGVPGEVIAFGGGGPHCITQQIPASGVTPR